MPFGIEVLRLAARDLRMSIRVNKAKIFYTLSVFNFFVLLGSSGSRMYATPDVVLSDDFFLIRFALLRRRGLLLVSLVLSIVQTLNQYAFCWAEVNESVNIH